MILKSVTVFLIGSWFSVVGIGTFYMLYEPGEGEVFRTHPYRPQGLPTLLYNVYLG